MAYRARRVMRRRAVARTAAVSGAAYYAGKRGQQAAQREADQDAQIAALQAQAAQPSAAPPAPAAPASASPTMEQKVEQLRQLANLRDEGILTDEEFAAQKQEILGAGASAT
jgi:cell envelope opacity-associated protein A